MKKKLIDILMFEPEGTLREICSYIAEREGFTMLTASSESNAKILLSAFDFKVVFIDLSPYESKGREDLINTCTECGLKDRTILMSASKPKTDHKWLSKPFDVDAFLQIVRTYCGLMPVAASS